MTRRSPATPPRVAAYGYFGMGNIGNEGSLAAFLAYLRQAHPQASVRCFAADPEEVRRAHGIPATRLMTYRAPRDRGGLLVKAAKASSRLWDVPRTFALMRDVDVLVVPGTGVLESSLVATPWGLPYWLFLAALSCRLRGRKVALVSVGAEYAEHPLTRRLYRWTVRLSDYCTYRDEGSRDAVRAMGVPGEPGEAFPDLAFALPVPPAGPPCPGHLVVGVMRYSGNPRDPGHGPEVERRYTEDMGRLLVRLVDGGHTVTLVVGDEADRGLAAELVDLVRSARPALPAEAVEASGAATLDALMAEMARAEAVVASRFHNVICGLKAARPTASLGYAAKSASLLARFGLAEFSQPADAFDVDRLAGHVAALERQQPALEALMKETLVAFEDALDRQFRRLSREVLTPDEGGPRLSAGRSSGGSSDGSSGRGAARRSWRPGRPRRGAGLRRRR